jgi:hypothetical protein
MYMYTCMYTEDTPVLKRKPDASPTLIVTYMHTYICICIHAYRRYTRSEEKAGREPYSHCCPFECVAQLASTDFSAHEGVSIYVPVCMCVCVCALIVAHLSVLHNWQAQISQHTKG